MPLRFRLSPKPVITKPPVPKPPVKVKPKPSTRATANAGTNIAAGAVAAGTVGLLPSLVNAGGALGTAAIGGEALKSTLDTLAENPMLLAAVAGVVALVLLR